MRFLVHGSIAYDLLLGYDGAFPDAIDAENLDKLSVSFVAPTFQRHYGGTAANIAWNLNLIGQDPVLVGTVGTDGAAYTTFLQKHGIDISHIEHRDDSITATAVIATDNAERQIAFFHPGADALGTHPDHSAFKDCALAIIGPRNPVLMLDAAARCHEKNIPYLFDPGQLAHVFSKDEFQQAVRQSRGLIVNEYEWKLASERMDSDTDDVVSACGLVIITRGEKGVHLKSANEEIDVPAARPEKVMNPTGAGDALRAGILSGLAAGWSLTETGRLGAVLGSFAVEHEGTLLEGLALEDVRRRYLETYNAKLPL